MTGTWRCFVAVPIGDELRAALAAAVEQWSAREDLAGLRWSDAENWHLTIAFLGSTDPGAVASIVGRLEATAGRHQPMRLETGGLGAFASRRRARVAWYGLADPGGRLASLAADVAVAMGLEPAGRFRAHVTLARARSEPVDLRPWLAEAAAPRGVLSVDGLDLMRSHLGRGPAHYERLASVPLGAPIRG